MSAITTMTQALTGIMQGLFIVAIIFAATFALSVIAAVS